MRLYLQFGNGMMEHSRVLVEAWGGGTVILSPRDLEDARLISMGAEIRALPNGRVLLDPQLYLPHADHDRLCGHAYWPVNYNTGTFWWGSDLDDLLNDLADLNKKTGTFRIILPGMLAGAVDDDWLGIQAAILDRAHQILGGQKFLVTVALSADAVKDMSEIHKLLDAAEGWPEADVYLVCEHPKGEYLSSEPAWLANVLDLTATFRLQGRRVILGYCNHQMLIAASSAATAIASGTWMNVRVFPPEKFGNALEDDIKRKAPWYYCPQALSEFKLPYLDAAYNAGNMAVAAPAAGMDTASVTKLFSGTQPTTVGLHERDAFRHYLKNLRLQAHAATQASFAETVAYHARVLDDAEIALSDLHKLGVRGQHRDFANVIDVNRSALAQLQARVGPTLSREWAKL